MIAMNSLPARRSGAALRKRSLRPKKSKKPAAAAYAPIPPVLPSVARSSSSTARIKKPMRPLTAYHIFFQIEREYVIQTTAGPVADESIHANKTYLPDVPRRYRWIKLSPDWYAGPGKRKKRKHRKSHGKIGFLELSQVVSKRWATLGATDPETKRYVTMIAARELDEYKLEMKRYKHLTENMAAPLTPDDANAVASDRVGAMISPIASPGPVCPSPRPMEVSSSTFLPTMPRLQQPIEFFPAESSELAFSSKQDFAAPVSSVDNDEIDYSICSVSNNGHYIPSPGPALSSSGSNMIQPDGIICDPLFELEDACSFQQPAEMRCVSPLSAEINVDNVDIIGDRGCFQLLSC